MERSALSDERRLVPQWSPELIVLSYCISWLGAYTSTQIVIHAKYSRNIFVKWLWILLASLAFGFSAIWAMHFVGMLACRMDIKIRFNIPLTIFSAFVAVVFTFVALASAYIPETMENSKIATAMTHWSHAWQSISFCSSFNRQHDLEAAGYMPVSTTADESGNMPINVLVTHVDEEEEEEGDLDEQEGLRCHKDTLTSRDSTLSFSGEGSGQDRFSMPILPSPSPVEDESRRRSQTSAPPTAHGSVVFPYAPPNQAPSRPSLARENDDSITTVSDSLSTDASGSQNILTRARSDSTNSPSPSFSSGNSWNEPLHAGLSREARLRIKAHTRGRPMPKFGWRYWLKAHYDTITLLLLLRAAIWAFAIVFMHYSGMWAMIIPEGRISWNLGVVALSYVVALIVCFIACVTMLQMEAHFGRQVAFSTIAAAGCCSMHYTGMAAATFYTRAPPDQNAGYPAYLPFVIVGVALVVCVISNMALAHSAITSRNRMAEMVLTKRRLWRIMAERNAAEQANELKQQFISVASHEIRTPLHAVNGYCELLALTNLTEEQSLYVTSIQQACHAINVIAGNVLDFSKLDRNNVELSARPVPVDMRKMVENLARITETKGLHPGQPGVDVIVSVSDGVPPMVYLDETYTFRIYMNLLSNAQKFCESGYICVAVAMESIDQVTIKVSDTGCGIPKSFRSALFQPFRQADTSLTKPRQGTGLGLSIVKHLLQRMGGTVEVDSTEGDGTIFIIKLPTTAPAHSPRVSTKRLTASKRIKVFYRHSKTAALYVDLFNSFGLSASLGTNQCSLVELSRDADFIWTDVESLNSSESLRRLMSSNNWHSLPPLFIVHSDATELASLEPFISSARGIVLVKRPVVVHNMLDLLEDPAPHQGKHIKAPPAKVRFALPEDNGIVRNGKGTCKEETIDISPLPVLTLPSISEQFSEPEVRRRVLLVEDNLVSQHIGRRFLEKLGYEVVSAIDGQEAIDKAQNGPYICCLMDCQMPKLDGFAATAKIRELESNGTINGRLPIIALTANVSNDNEEKCKSSGMDSFLAKPLRLKDLQAAVERFSE